MSESHTTPTKHELLRRMDDGLAAFLAVIDQLSDEQMLGPTDAEGWNVRDHLTHLAVWADGVTALLRREDRWAAMGLEMDDLADNKPDFDTMNAQIVVQHRHLSPAEARAWLVDAHARLAAAVRALPDSELSAPYDHFVAPPAGNRREPVTASITGDTYEHYAEHLPWIEAIVRA